jgi:urease accessory protein
VSLPPIDSDALEKGQVAGTVRLRFERCGEQTMLTRCFASSPAKMFTTRGAGRACWVYSATLGGGLVGGDEIRTTLEVGAGARALVATQASTKVYRSLRPASQHISGFLDDDALLAVVPDPIVCFAGAHFSQEQRYDLRARANLVLVDWMSSGRHAIGERWAFRHYASRIDVRRAGKRILYDAVLLSDADGGISERLGRFDVCLTALVTGPDVAAAAAGIVDAASRLPVEKHAPLVVSAWPLADQGALVRIAGQGVEQVGAALRERFRFLLDWLGDDFWSRKW